MTLPERVPLLLATHACVPRLRLAIIIRQRHEHHCSSAVRDAEARGWCGSGCVDQVKPPTVVLYESAALFVTPERLSVRRRRTLLRNPPWAP